MYTRTRKLYKGGCRYFSPSNNIGIELTFACFVNNFELNELLFHEFISAPVHFERPQEQAI